MTTTRIRLRLIRHPKPDVTPGLCYGRLDVPAEQADLERLVSELHGTRKPDHVYSSPLQRCRLTALAMHDSGWPAPSVDHRIAEMNFGDWEGRLWEELDRSELETWRKNIADHVPPGGESVRAIATRAHEFARSVLDLHRSALPMSSSRELDIAVFTHAGIIQTLPRIWRGEPLSGFSGTRVEYGSTTELWLA